MRPARRGCRLPCVRCLDGQPGGELLKELVRLTGGQVARTVPSEWSEQCPPVRTGAELRVVVGLALGGVAVETQGDELLVVRGDGAELLGSDRRRHAGVAVRAGRRFGPGCRRLWPGWGCRTCSPHL